MSFDLYFAGVTSKDCNVRKFLYSQYNDRSTIARLRGTLGEEQSKLFLDSGAWSAYTRGVEIDIDEYLQYINCNDDIISVCASVDVLPKNKVDASQAALQSWQNFLYMREHIQDVSKLIPVYHQAEPISNLHRILDYEDSAGKISYIGIGALANTKDRDARNRFIDECFSVIMRVRPDIKVHGFGMTDLELLELYPFYSADSTTWRMAAVMGEILTKFGRIIISDRRRTDSAYSLRDEHSVNVIDAYVREFGFDLSKLRCDAELRAQFNICYLLDWEKSYSCKYVRPNKHKLF